MRTGTGFWEVIKTRGRRKSVTMKEMSASPFLDLRSSAEVRKADRRVLAALACAILLSVELCATCEAQDAQERILSFASQIIVSPDATMLVTETIRVRSSGDQIKRGIYRDFPTRYKDRHGNAYVVGFEIHEV